MMLAGAWYGLFAEKDRVGTLAGQRGQTAAGTHAATTASGLARGGRRRV